MQTKKLRKSELTKGSGPNYPSSPAHDLGSFSTFFFSLKNKKCQNQFWQKVPPPARNLGSFLTFKTCQNQFSFNYGLDFTLMDYSHLDYTHLDCRRLDCNDVSTVIFLGLTHLDCQNMDWYDLAVQLWQPKPHDSPNFDSPNDLAVQLRQSNCFYSPNKKRCFFSGKFP